VNDQRRPVRVPGIELQTTGGDLLVHDTRAAKVHVFNTTAGRIFTLCDGERTVSEIVSAVIAEWGIDSELATADVVRALADFTELGLLERGLPEG
jgi:pyrroloquinoline quinone biosynthesis protein D